MIPMVTVCLTTYSRGDIIKDTLANLSEQTYENLEIIVIDDNNCDLHREKTKECERENTNNNIKFIFNDTNIGLSANRNIAINIGAGKYFSFKDDDDYWHPEYISEMVESALKNNADIVLCENYELGNDNFQNVNLITLRDAIIKGYTPPVGSQLYSLSMLKAIGGYSKVSTGVDHDLWIQLLPKYGHKEIFLLNKRLCVPDYFHQKKINNKMTLDFEKRVQGIQSSLSCWEDILSSEISNNFYRHFVNEYYIYMLRKFGSYYLSRSDFYNIYRLLCTKKMFLRFPTLLYRIIVKRLGISGKINKRQLFKSYD